MDHAAAMKRIAVRGDGQKDRMESEPDAFFEKVRKGYLTLAKEEPDRIVVVEADGSTDEVERAILSIESLHKQLNS